VTVCHAGQEETGTNQDKPGATLNQDSRSMHATLKIMIHNQHTHYIFSTADTNTVLSTTTWRYLNTTTAPSLLLPYEQMYIQLFHRNNQLIPEQHPNEQNPMFQPLYNRYETSFLLTGTADSHSSECVIPDDVLIQFGPPDDEHLLLETCRGIK
jgi:hypothetical protein